MAKGSVQIVVERCKACGFCVEFCPTHALALSSAFNAKGYHPPNLVNPKNAAAAIFAACTALISPSSDSRMRSRNLPKTKPPSPRPPHRFRPTEEEAQDAR